MFIEMNSYQITLDEYLSGYINEDDLNESFSDFRKRANVSLILAVGSIVFLVFPYMINLYYAANIKYNPIIQKNTPALNIDNPNNRADTIPKLSYTPPLNTVNIMNKLGLLLK